MGGTHENSHRLLLPETHLARNSFISQQKGSNGKYGRSDDVIERVTENWERSDGAVYALRELALIRPDVVPQFFPILTELVNKKAGQCDLRAGSWLTASCEHPC